MDDDILYDVDGGIATLTFNRPEKLNALTPEMNLRFSELIVEAEAADDVRAIILTGAGRAFCAGGDTSRLADAATPPSEDLKKQAARQPADLLLRVTKPLIAAVNGAAAGIGLARALSCDVVFASSEAVLTFAFSRYGLVAEFDISWLVPRLVGTGRALDLLWTSRRFSGREAYEYGLVQYATEPGRTLNDARVYTERLLTDVSAYSLLAIKKQVYGNWDRTRAQALEDGLHRMRISMTESDFAQRAAG